MDCAHLTLLIDVQAKALFYLVAGWDENFGGYVVDYGTEPDQQRNHFTLWDVNHWFDCLLGAAVAASIDGAHLPGLQVPQNRPREAISVSALRARRR